MSELNKKNVLVCKQIFDINNEYKLNLYEGDSLKVYYNKEFGIKQFDIIIGNPPYNKDNIGTGNSIWQLFVKKSINELNKKGYLVFIHPSTWRKPQSEKSKMKEYFKLMTNDNKMLYLEIHNSKDGIKTFGCATRYDYYVLQKEKNINNITIIKDEKGITNKINLLDYEWLPNYYFDKFNKLFHNNKEPSCELLFDCNIYETRRKWVSKTQNNEYKYKLINAITKKEIKYYYTNDNTKGLFGIKKIIFGTAGINEPLNDKNGEYGMTEHTMAIKYNTEQEANNIIKCLKSEKFLNLINACNWSSFLLDWRLFTYFKKNFYELLDFEENNITNCETKSDENIIIPKVAKKKTTTKKIIIDSNENKDVVELSDENIIIPKVSKKKTTTKKIIIDKDIKKEEIKEENLTIEDIKESNNTKECNIIIEDIKPKVKSIKKAKVKKETEIKIENIEENNIKIDNIIETENPKVKSVKKIKIKKEDNIIIEDDKPKVKTIKKVKAKKETNEI